MRAPVDPHGYLARARETFKAYAWSVRHGLRLVVYDQTCTARPWLTQSWIAGSLIARARGELDAALGVTSWAEATAWLAEYGEGMPIAEIQYWGHGKWGELFVDEESLDVSALRPGHRLHDSLRRIRARMEPESRWWFRTCETFGAQRGQDFASAWTDFFGCPAAGHTFIIGPWQSGLHNLEPGQRPAWSASEGLAEGSADAPTRALWSRVWRPRTINCLRMRIPQRLLSE